MRIALISPLSEAVPPRLYGGTERVVHALAEELVSRGHDVTLFASGDSRTSARLIACVPRALRFDAGCRDGLAPHLAMLERVTEMASEFDLIHNHADYLAYPFVKRWAAPAVTTLHGRLDLPELLPLYARFNDVNLISISDRQRAPLDAVRPNWTRTVYNGVNLRHFTFSPNPGRYLVFLGRVSEEKRPDLAVAVARQVGMPIKIAAKIDAADREWSARHFEPLLDDPLVDFLGEVDEDAKAGLLRGAAALLFPTMWPEPFGMVMIEALACGTPVVALRHGSVPEVIRDGVNGFIRDDVAGMAQAVLRIADIDRRACRASVEERFSAARMADGYEAAYAQVLESGAPGCLRPAGAHGSGAGAEFVPARRPSVALRRLPVDDHLDLASRAER
ncbi:MAG TPA: glycosyltransferase family 4 protein [Thermomicrobiaceae bacterium]|nr:glycosyltransferase family 4 protein [Thermomicrobiaceae bacterium]